MKKFVAPILIITLLLISVFSLRSCFRANQKNKALSDEKEQLLKNLKPVPLNPVKTTKDRSGATHQIYEPAMVAENADVLSSGFIPKKLADSLKKVIDAKDSEIKSVTLAKIKIEAQLKSVLKTDTSGKPFYSAKDSVFEVTTYPDSNLVKVTASVGIAGIVYVKKPLFKKAVVRAELFANDKRVEFSDIYMITKPYDDGKKRGFLPAVLALGILATTYFVLK